jgi:lysophospholipase L1-like esterase
VSQPSAPETTHPPLHYVSLGDSFPAGEGQPGAVPPCQRSPGAYPELVAARAGLVASVHACSGATVDDVLDVEQHPGIGRQIDAVAADADVVTISVGGNDLGFARVLADCVLATQPCTRLDPAVDASLDALGPRLVAVYRAIRARAPHALLLVVGYQQLVADPDHFAYQACAGLTPDEARWLREKDTALAGVTRVSAEAAGARYLDAIGAFAGHEACTPDPWMTGVDLSNIGASFHPNAAGHDTLARLVGAALVGR